MRRLSGRLAYLVGSIVLITSVCSWVAYCQSLPQKRFPRVDFGQLGATVGRLTFNQRTAFPAVPPAVRVYKVVPVASRKAAFLELVKALPITRSPEVEAQIQQLERAPEPQLPKDKPLQGDIGGWGISVYPGGQFYVHNMNVSLDGRDAEAPSPEEARRAADAFLSRTGLLPAGARFAEVYDAEVSVWGLGDKPGDKVVHTRAVRYQGWIEGIPRYGSFGVELGPGGEVVRVNSRFRRTAPDQVVTILSPEESLGKLRVGEGHIASGPSWDATAYVDSIRLVYWEGVTADSLSYIMPIYVFEGEAVAEGKKTEPLKVYVEAVRPELLAKEHLERPLRPE